MSSRDKKIHKTVRLDPAIFEAIEAFKNITGKDRSGAIEELITRGLERTEEIEEIRKKLSDRMSKLERRQREDTERIVNLIIGLARLTSKVYGITNSHFKNSFDLSSEQIKSAESYGIKSGMSELKWKEKELSYEEI